MSLRNLTLSMSAATAVFAAACGDSMTNGGYQGEPRHVASGAIHSLSKVAEQHPTYLAVQWYWDDGRGDVAKTQLLSVSDTSFPAKFRMPLYDEPEGYVVDFGRIADKPTCGTPGPNGKPIEDHCFPPGEPRPKGRGKLAIGNLFVFDDVDGDGQFTQPDASPEFCAEVDAGVYRLECPPGSGLEECVPVDASTLAEYREDCAAWKRPHDVLRGISLQFLFYAKDLDADALETLEREGFPTNPRALKPGFNMGRSRCAPEGKTFDTLEVVPFEDISVESLEVIEDLENKGQLCFNWT